MKIKLLLSASLVVLIACNKKNQPSEKQEALNDSINNKIEKVIRPDSAGEQNISVVYLLNSEHSLTVGGKDADITGFTSQAIQTAVDALHNQGGGTVILQPGTFTIPAPVRLYSNMTIRGSGKATVLKKIKGYHSPFAIDADYGELKITVVDASGFAPGMGIQVYDSVHRYGFDATTATITAIKGNVLYINNYLLRDYRSDREGIVSNACSVISAVEAENITIVNLTVDGNRSTNDLLDGCLGGGIYLHKVAHATIENVLVKDFANDGISWQITENVTVRNCEITGCLNAGLHPGTGSPYTLIEGNNSHHNDAYGLFVCWRVQNGIVRNNQFHHNGKNGVCTGHKDTDMLFENNHIYENAADGINFRGETRANAPNRNTFRNNLVENNGTKDGGYGFSFNSPAEGVLLEHNTIRNTSGGKQKAAVYMFSNALPVTMKDNLLSGLPDGKIVYEKK